MLLFTRLTCAVAVALLLGTMPALAAENTVTVQNNSGEPISVWVLTASGTPMYGPFTLNNGDRYMRHDIDRAVIVRVRSTRCNELQVSLSRAEWSVDVKRAGTGCTLVTATRSFR